MYRPFRRRPHFTLVAVAVTIVKIRGGVGALFPNIGIVPAIPPAIPPVKMKIADENEDYDPNLRRSVF